MDSNEIILDVFELKNNKPILKFKVLVYGGIIISVNNTGIINGITKVINEVVNEILEISELTKIEKLEYSSQLTHSFEIKKLGYKNLFLNLTEKDLIELGFKEIPERKKITHKIKLAGIKIMAGVVFLAALTTVVFNVMGVIQIFPSIIKNTKQNPSEVPEVKDQPVKESFNSQKDSIFYQETDSLSNNSK